MRKFLFFLYYMLPNLFFYKDWHLLLFRGCLSSVLSWLGLYSDPWYSSQVSFQLSLVLVCSAVWDSDTIFSNLYWEHWFQFNPVFCSWSIYNLLPLFLVPTGGLLPFGDLNLSLQGIPWPLLKTTKLKKERITNVKIRKKQVTNIVYKCHG